MGDQHRRDGGLPRQHRRGREDRSTKGVTPSSSSHSPSAHSPIPNGSPGEALDRRPPTWTATARDPSQPPGIASSGPQAWSDGVEKRINTATRVIGRDSGFARRTYLYPGIRRRSAFCSARISGAGPLACVGSPPEVGVE
jgi:hypothetical protein